MPLPVKFKILHVQAVLPTYAHGAMEDAGMDLRSVETLNILPGEVVMVHTGLAMQLEPGFEGQIRSRSGMATKYKVAVINSPGTVDPGYRGELCVSLINHGSEAFYIYTGDRIAQLVIGVYVMAQPEVAEELNDSARGVTGFGHSGK